MTTDAIQRESKFKRQKGRADSALNGFRNGVCLCQVMNLPISELDVWTFKKDTNGRWIWLRHSPGGEALTASRADYDELEECLADARQRGYNGSMPT